MTKLLAVLTLNLASNCLLLAQAKFSWADTIPRVGQMRSIQLARAFDGSCTVRPCYEYYHNKETYDTLVSFLKKNDKVCVAFFWHTWTYDDYEYNLHISKRMADGLIEELVRQGISEDRIGAIGLGESRPLFSEAELKTMKDDERNRRDRENWRVDVLITSAPHRGD